MGDPSLRLNPVAPVSDLAALNNGNGVILSWAPSPESVVGYHVYRAPSAAGPFNRLTDLAREYLELHGPSGSVADTYMVRAVKLEVTSSGSYYNPSQGMFISGAGDFGFGWHGHERDHFDSNYDHVREQFRHG
jgi:hypothetical protein